MQLHLACQVNRTMTISCTSRKIETAEQCVLLALMWPSGAESSPAAARAALYLCAAPDCAVRFSGEAADKYFIVRGAGPPRWSSNQRYRHTDQTVQARRTM